MAGWDGLAATLQLQERLDELILSLSGTTRPCFILDGADRIEGDGPRRAINDLLDAIGQLPKDPEGRSRWGKVITLRSEMLGSVQEWLDLTGPDVEILQVPGLSEGDVAALANERPHLAWILAAPQVGPVVRNPFFLRTLEEVPARDSASSSRPVTEVEVHELWWHRFVGKNRDRGRQQLLIQLGEEWLARNVRRFPNRDFAPDIVRGLERDDILRYHRTTDSFVFGHDILEEWTAVRVLRQREPDALGYLQQLGNSFWAWRPLQLLACMRLEDEYGVERWKDLLVAAEGLPEASSRWTDAVLTAPFRSARLQELMPGVGEVLQENGGSRLLHFLRSLRTQAIEPNRTLEKRLREASQSSPRVDGLILKLGEPLKAQWIPVLTWLVPRLFDFPESCREEASQVMAIWERATRAEGPFRREIAEAALAWRLALLPVDGHRRYAPREAEPYFERLRDIIVASTDAVPERIPEIFAHLRATEGTEDLKRWLAAAPVRRLIQQAPAAYAEFTLDVLVPQWRQKRPREMPLSRQAPFPFTIGKDIDPEWKSLRRDYAFSPESRRVEPFLSVLEADEAAGLHLISTLVDRATASRLRESKLKGYSRLGPNSIVLSLPAGKRKFLGGRLIYLWSRSTSEAPPSVRCALTALNLWMKQQIESGRNAQELFATGLSVSRSIAFVATCVSAFAAYPDRCFRAAVPFVTHPFIWDCDYGIRSYIRPYIFSADKEISDYVRSKVRRFPNRIFAAHADPKNYYEQDGQVWFKPPTKLLEPHGQQHLANKTRYIQLLSWIHEVAKQSQNFGSFTVAQAIERAKELQQPDDFSSLLSRHADDYERMERLGAIVGAATTVLRLDLPGVIDLGQLPWCEEMLIAAAQTPCDEEAGWRSVLPGDFILAAAQGLLFLLENGHAGERNRNAFFDLLLRPEGEIVDFVFGKVPALWNLEPIFCHNAVARELALAVEPWTMPEEPEDEFDASILKADAKIQEIKTKYAQNTRENRFPVIMSFGDLSTKDRLETDHVERALRTLPLEKLAWESDFHWVLDVSDRALTWTLRQLKFQDPDHPSDRWLAFLGDWLARLSRHLQASEVERMILRPLQEGWPGTARLMEEVLVGWTEHRLVPSDQISEESKKSWRTLAETILNSSEQPRPSLRDRILELLLHVRNGGAFLTEHWQGASEFLDLYERWVEAIAPTPWGFSRLLLFLKGAGKNLGVDRAVRWVSSAVARSTDRDKLWREYDNLSQTAEWLTELWEGAEAQIRREPEVQVAYVSLLDELVWAGSPLAEQLRRKTMASPSTLIR